MRALEGKSAFLLKTIFKANVAVIILINSWIQVIHGSKKDHENECIITISKKKPSKTVKLQLLSFATETFRVSAHKLMVHVSFCILCFIVTPRYF